MSKPINMANMAILADTILSGATRKRKHREPTPQRGLDRLFPHSLQDRLAFYQGFYGAMNTVKLDDSQKESPLELTSPNPSTLDYCNGLEKLANKIGKTK